MNLADDEPIALLAEDALDRQSLVDQVVALAGSRGSKPCLIVGITGPWGVGKSSVLGMARQKLGATAIRVEFNPWMYSGFGDSFAGLLRELIAGVESDGGTVNKQSSRLRASLHKYLQVLQPLAEVIPAAATKGVKVSGIMSFVERWLAPRETVYEIKRAVSAEIAAIGKPVAVFVDDVDRLDKEQIEFVLKTIRLCADFQCVTYFIAMDKDVVLKLLRGRLGAELADVFLERFVQLELPVPPPSAAQAAKYIRTNLVSLVGLQASSLDTLLGRADAEDLRAWGVRPEIQFPELVASLRAAKRYANSVATTFPLVSGEVFESDFLLLEYLRCFHPGAYAFASQHRGELAAFDDSLGLHRGERSGHPLAGAVQSFQELHQQATAKRALEALFPRFETAGERGNHTYSRESGDDWERDLRICHPDNVDRYFSLLRSGNKAVFDCAKGIVRSAAKRDSDEARESELEVALREVPNPELLLRRIDLESTGQDNDSLIRLLRATNRAFASSTPPTSEGIERAAARLILAILDRIEGISGEGKTYANETIAVVTPWISIALAEALTRAAPIAQSYNLKVPSGESAEALSASWRTSTTTAESVIARYPERWTSIFGRIAQFLGREFLLADVARLLAAQDGEGAVFSSKIVGVENGKVRVALGSLAHIVNLHALSTLLANSDGPESFAVTAVRNAVSWVQAVRDEACGLADALRAVARMSETPQGSANGMPEFVWGAPAVFSANAFEASGVEKQVREAVQWGIEIRNSLTSTAYEGNASDRRTLAAMAAQHLKAVERFVELLDNLPEALRPVLLPLEAGPAGGR